MAKKNLTQDELQKLSSPEGLYELCRKKSIDLERVVDKLTYEEDLRTLQIELGKLQKSVLAEGRRVVILFEGRDAAGKGGTILRFTGNLNPRLFRVVALPKPTEVEMGQWYFQRYATVLPRAGEIRFFDRSWYNRAVVEPVMGFCSSKQYKLFMNQVNQFEKMITDDGIELVKLWFAVSRREQKKRFDDRRDDPLKQWKISPVDEIAQKKWKTYTKYITKMMKSTDTPFGRWTIVDGDNKYQARLESIRHVLSTLEYGGKQDAKVSLKPDREVILTAKNGQVLIGE